MIRKTIGALTPFIIFLLGQYITLACVFVSTDSHGENFNNLEDGYENASKYGRSLLKIIDFTFAKDGYKFKNPIGQFFYVFSLYFLNIITLNLVIALVGDKYDEVMQVRKETELKLKAQMLKEMYAIYSTF